MKDGKSLGSGAGIGRGPGRMVVGLERQEQGWGTLGAGKTAGKQKGKLPDQL